jgi:release factor glutamine methyltransferase
VAAVVSNPPYVCDGEWRRLPRDIRDHEPRAALTAGPDGLAVIRRLAAQAAARLPAGGLIALEIGADQREAVLGVLGGDGWEGQRVERDLAGRWRYALAVRKAVYSGTLAAASEPPLAGIPSR